MEYLGHRLRHEIKYYINNSVYHTLRTRLNTVAAPDPNMKDPEGYLISSLYFDDIFHSAMEEKLSGIQAGDPASCRGQLKEILSNEKIFGVDLVKAGLSEKTGALFAEMLAGRGAVRRVLRKYL